MTDGRLRVIGYVRVSTADRTPRTEGVTVTSLQDFADDIQREPLYAAYRAAHEQIERLGDDLLDDSIIQTAVKAYEAKLIEQGRLLPPGGEVSEQQVWPRFGESGGGTRQVITWPDGSSYHGPIVPDPPMSDGAIQAVRDRLRQIRETAR